MVELAEVLRIAGTTAILVSHDRDEATALASRVVGWDELQPA
jgi:ABC-type nitrate/sulfonate/bicarbonate transport system ATPase subunit